MTDKLYYQWNQFKKDCKSLADKVKKDKFNPEIIVGISRGGLLVAGMVSEYFEPRAMETISLNSYEGEEKGNLKMFRGVDKQFPCKKSALICDDVIDTGATMNVAKKLFPNSKLLVIHYKSKNKPIIEPDYFCRDEDKWIVYPWEE